MWQQESKSRANNIWTGIIAGTLVPLMMYGLIYFIRDGLVYQGQIAPEWAGSASSDRTLAIIAICANIIVIQIFNRKKYTTAMRGLVFPTIIYCGLWFYHYGMELINKI